MFKKILLIGIFAFLYACSTEPNTTIINNSSNGTINLDDIQCSSDATKLSWECSVTGRYSENGISNNLSYKWTFIDDDNVEYTPTSVTNIDSGSTAKYVFSKYPSAINNGGYKVRVSASYESYQLNREVNLDISAPVVSKIMVLPGYTINTRTFEPVLDPVSGSAVNYTWYFGDGKSQTTSSNSITYEYPTGDTLDYTVTVVASSDKFKTPVSNSTVVDLRPYTITGAEILSSYRDTGYIREYTFTTPAMAYTQEGSQVISKDLEYSWELVNRGKIIKSSKEKDFVVFGPGDIKLNDNLKYELRLKVAIKDNPASFKTTSMIVSPRYVTASVTGNTSSTNGGRGDYSAVLKFTDSTATVPADKFLCQWYVNGIKSGNAVSCNVQKRINFTTDHASKDGKVPVKINVEVSSDLMGGTSTSATYKVSVVPTEQDIVRIKDIGLNCTSPDNGLTQNCSVNFTFNDGVSTEEQERIKSTRNVQFRYMKDDGSNNVIASTTSGGTATFKLEYPEYIDMARTYNGYYERYVPVEVFIGWNGYAVKYGIFQIADLYVKVPVVAYHFGFKAPTGNVSPGNGSVWIGSGPIFKFTQYSIPKTFEPKTGCTYTWKYYMKDVANGNVVTQNLSALDKFNNMYKLDVNSAFNTIDMLPAIKEADFSSTMEGNPFLNESGFGVAVTCPKSIIPKGTLKFYGKGIGHAGMGKYSFFSIETGFKSLITPRIKVEVNKCTKRKNGQYEITYTATVDEGSREMIANNRYSRYFIGISNVKFAEKASGKTFTSETDNDIIKFDNDYVYSNTMLLNPAYDTSTYTLKEVQLYIAEYKYPSVDFSGEYEKVEASYIGFLPTFCVDE